MTTKPDGTPADLKLVEPPRAERAVDRLPAVANPSNAETIFFEMADGL